jgi:Tol biopolymer transport system component
LSDDDRFLLDLVDAVLEGRTLDWSDVELRASASQRDLVAHLRAVAAIASLNAAPTEVGIGSAVGCAWGHLKLLEPIGRGAFGTVYRAWDPQLRREVALKLLPGKGALGDSAIEEGRRLARVQHPNVVTIYGADRVDGIVGLWMELLYGDTLEEIVARDGPLPLGRTWMIAQSLCSAAAVVHRAGLVHRDIKAHNVIVEAEGRVVLMDFGAGRAIADDSAEDVAGTPLYLAPEIFAGDAPGPASDQYSIGVLLYYLLTARYPVEARTIADLRHAATQRVSARDIRELRPDVPRRAAEAIARALDPDPSRRYASLSDLGAALLPRRSSRMILVAAGALAGAAIVFPAMGRRAASAIRREAAADVLGDSTAVPTSRRLELPPAILFANGLSYDGRIYAFAAIDGSPAVLDMSSGQVETYSRPDPDGYAEFAIASPDAEWFAYNWWGLANRVTIHLVNRRTRYDRVIFSDTAIDSARPADWSRDGSTIVVLASLEDGIGRVLLVDVASGRQRIACEIRFGKPSGISLSPDGRYLTYDLPDTQSPSRHTLRIVPLGGQERELLPDDRSGSRFPMWTPDGQRIFFISDRAGSPDGWVVPVVNGEATGEPRVVARNLARVSSLGLTVSGAVYYQLQDREFEVYELPLDPRTMQVAGTPHVVAGAFHGSNVGPSYSHDGRLLAYISQRSQLGGALGTRVIVVHDRNSNQDRDLAPPLYLEVTSPIWSPDDRQLLVQATDFRNRWGYFVIDAATSQVKNRIVWPNSAMTDYGRARWSDDGTAILFGHGSQIFRHSLVTEEDQVAFADPSSPPRRIGMFAYAVDGQLAYAAPGENSSLNVVDTSGTLRSVVTVARPQALQFQGWFPDSRHLLYSTAVIGRHQPDRLWRIAAAGGTPESIDATVDGITRVNTVALDPWGTALAYTTGSVGSTVWMMEHFLPR